MRKSMTRLAAMAALVACAVEYVPNPETQNVEKDIVYGEHERCRVEERGGAD